MRLRLKTDRDGRWSVTPAESEDDGTDTLLPPGAPPPEYPPTPLDAWWNRRFPPHSTARLIFLLCALPVVGAVHALITRLRGGEVSLSRYLFATIVGGVLLAFLWLSGVLRPRHPGLPQRGRPEAPPRRSVVREFLVALPFCFGAVFVVALVTAGGAFEPWSLLMSVVAGVMVSLIVVLRHSIWSVVLFSLVVGLGGGLLLHLFLLVWGFEDSFVESWLLVSMLVFLWAAPIWLGMRRGLREAQRRTGVSEPPMWVLMTGSLILVVGSALFFAIAGGAEELEPSPPPASASPAAPAGMPTRESAALELFESWREGDRQRALRVAHVRAVDELLAAPVPAAPRFVGCGTIEGGRLRCAVETAHRMLFMTPEFAGSGFVLRSVEWVPPGTPIELDSA